MRTIDSVKSFSSFLAAIALLAGACGGASPSGPGEEETPVGGIMLEADGPGDTYGIIEQAGYGVEVPDCGHGSFGSHITEAWDDALGKNVFVFHAHVAEDDDRCINTDRQRTEIKTYGPSPGEMKGTQGERHRYAWKFRLDAEFRPSPNFTHIHQIKGDGGGLPLVTLTPRAGQPDRMQIIHTGSNGNASVVFETPLAPFLGVWIEAREAVLHEEEGTYELTLRRVSDGEILLEWSSDSLDLWLAEKPFNRPKYGIYRSLNSAQVLRDEEVRFADFCLAEGSSGCW